VLTPRSASAQLLAEVALAPAIASQLFPPVSWPSGSLRAVGSGADALVARVVPDRANWQDWEVYTAGGLAASLEGALVYGVERDLMMQGLFRAETTETTVGAERPYPRGVQRRWQPERPPRTSSGAARNSSGWSPAGAEADQTREERPMPPTDHPAWQALRGHRRDLDGVHMRDLFARDPERFERYHATVGDVLVDYSKHRIDDATLALALDLARQAGVPQMIEAMCTGERINRTEDRAVLHTALRHQGDDPITSTAST
jgi:hypothetical protein